MEDLHATLTARSAVNVAWRGPLRGGGMEEELERDEVEDEMEEDGDGCDAAAAAAARRSMEFLEGFGTDDPEKEIRSGSL